MPESRLGEEGLHRGNLSWEGEMSADAISRLASQHVLDLGRKGGKMAFRFIPPGKFWMGSRGYYGDEEPRHQVEITRGFWLGETPVTQRQFAAWTAAGRIEHKNGFSGLERPAESLSWREASQFCGWLAETRGREFPEGAGLACLPTEAEWEYACRAGSESEYAEGDGEEALREAGWFAGNASGETQPVGAKRANAFGLFDMHGNVEEWCHDVWEADAYRGRLERVADPGFDARLADWEAGLLKMLKADDGRVLRGGSWFNSARDCRSAFRDGDRPVGRFGLIGFRVCLVPGPAKPSGARERDQHGRATGDGSRGTRLESNGAAVPERVIPDLARAKFPRNAGSKKL